MTPTLLWLHSVSPEAMGSFDDLASVELWRKILWSLLWKTWASSLSIISMEVGPQTDTGSP